MEITDDMIRLTHSNSSASYKFMYCLGEPVFDVFPKDPTKLTIIFSQKYESETLKFLMELFGDV